MTDFGNGVSSRASVSSSSSSSSYIVFWRCTDVVWDDRDVVDCNNGLLLLINEDLDGTDVFFGGGCKWSTWIPLSSCVCDWLGSSSCVSGTCCGTG